MSRSEPAKQVRLSPGEADERILIEAAQRDGAHFADLYEKYFHIVYAYVTRRTSDRAESEDVTSEVFRKAFANLKRFKWTGAPFGAWLFRIAANLIADREKKAAREKRVDTAGESPFRAGPRARSQQLSMEDAERRARLFRMVDNLAGDQRRVVVMRFAEEKSIREIANELRRSEGAVKQLQFRALQTLRARLAADES